MPDPPDRPRGRSFATTRWTLVLAAGDRGSPESDAALAALCETYWPAVYAFVRRSGHDADRARDLTQSFFARVLEKNYFGAAERERGRFRAFLLASVRHFLANEWDRERALKRGGGRLVLPMDVDDGERSYRIEPVDRETPERLYERRWAMTVLDAAMRRVRERYAGSGRLELFRRLRPYLTGAEPGSYAALAAELGATEGSLRVAVHRLRQQFAAALREVVGETVEAPDEVEAELSYLLTATEGPDAPTSPSRPD